jgi:hypothetical protein
MTQSVIARPVHRQPAILLFCFGVDLHDLKAKPFADCNPDQAIGRKFIQTIA